MKKLMIFVLTLGIGFLMLGVETLVKTATAGRMDSSNDGMVLQTKSKILDDLRDEFGSNSNYMAGLTGINIISGTRNIRQSTMNNYYNTNTPNKREVIGGTCGIIAALMMINYLNNVKFHKVTGNDNKIFSDLVEIAYDLGFSAGGGMIVMNEDDLLRNYLTNMGMTDGLNIDNDYWFLSDNYVESIDNKKPCILSYNTHMLLACGYLTYTVTYSKLWWTETKTKRYFVVNDGWSDGRLGDDTNYSYIDFDGLTISAITKI